MKPVSSGDPFISIPGSLNFRDFGGYRTRDGAVVRPGKLFRCGSLARIPAENMQQLQQLGISTICDLRRVDEAEASPTTNLPESIKRVHIPIAPGSSEMLRESFSDQNARAEDRIHYMEHMTRELVRDHQQDYAKLVEALLATEGGFLVHCSAGKDRTGFSALIILAALGVPNDTIIHDYLLTNEAGELFAFMGPRIAEYYGYAIDHESLMAVAGVRQEYIEAIYAELEESYGGLAAYLEAIGITSEVKKQLRQRFTELPEH